MEESMSELKPDYKLFECENGKTYGAHKRSCLFCKHCTDIFYDYTNGPYMFICGFECDLDMEEAKYKSFKGLCPKFEEE